MILTRTTSEKFIACPHCHGLGTLDTAKQAGGPIVTITCAVCWGSKTILVERVVRERHEV